MQTKLNQNIIIAGGGTGGHLFPAISIGEEMISMGYNVKFIGSKRGFDSTYFGKSNYDYKLLDIYGYKREFNFKTIKSNIFLIFKMMVAIIEMIQVFIKYKPMFIVGTGGYISAIPLLLGLCFRKKIFIQEQNIVPGRTTRLFSRYAEKIFLGFNELIFYENDENLMFTGNPLRRFKSNFKIKSKAKVKKTLLIIGGSQGAKPINDFFIENYNKLIKKNIFLIWQCGQKNIKEIREKIKEYQNIQLVPFIENIEEAYSNSDLVISRAGAISISELMIFNKPTIFIPYPHAADNHQYLNAKFIESKGAGVLVEQKEIKTLLLDKVESVMNDLDRLNMIMENTKKIAKSESSKMISIEIGRLVK